MKRQYFTHEPVGHAYHAPQACGDCGCSVPHMRGQTRGNVLRCGKCDIKHCDAWDLAPLCAQCLGYHPPTAVQYCAKRQAQ